VKISTCTVFNLSRLSDCRWGDDDVNICVKSRRPSKLCSSAAWSATASAKGLQYARTIGDSRLEMHGIAVSHYRGIVLLLDAATACSSTVILLCNGTVTLGMHVRVHVRVHGYFTFYVPAHRERDKKRCFRRVSARPSVCLSVRPSRIHSE